MGVAELERKSSEGTLAQGPAGSRGTNRAKVWERIFQAEGAASEKVEMRLMCCGAARRPLVVKVHGKFCPELPQRRALLPIVTIGSCVKPCGTPNCCQLLF